MAAGHCTAPNGTLFVPLRVVQSFRVQSDGRNATLSLKRREHDDDKLDDDKLDDEDKHRGTSAAHLRVCLCLSWR